mgnify:CR=1 FL=1
MRDLRAHGVDVVTIGQYLQPSSKHAQIDRWVHPDEFRWFREQGEALGFGSVFSGPLVRSSYRADEQRTRGRRPPAAPSRTSGFPCRCRSSAPPHGAHDGLPPWSMRPPIPPAVHRRRARCRRRAAGERDSAAQIGARAVATSVAPRRNRGSHERQASLHGASFSSTPASSGCVSPTRRDPGRSPRRPVSRGRAPSRARGAGFPHAKHGARRRKAARRRPFLHQTSSSLVQSGTPWLCKKPEPA